MSTAIGEEKAEKKEVGRTKTIIVCCDGTGNVGGAVTPTNVWRIRQAVAKQARDGRDQIVLFQDGVGTSSFQPLEILGKAISWGITANLEDLYARFISVYEPGDRVFLFGFSRGAFTVRTFSDLLYRCGVASCFDEREKHGSEAQEEKRRFQAHEIRALAKRAVQAYKLRHVKLEDGRTIAEAFRNRFGIESSDVQYHTAMHGPEASVPRRGHIPIEFIGVWDTVASVGLPFENTTQAIMRFWRRVTQHRAFRWASFAQLNFQRSGHWSNWEDDLHGLTRNAYHALAIDDERQAFRPVLWKEFDTDSSSATATQDTSEQTPPVGTRKTKVHVQQVWFAGMHANVGGGYAKDTLAYVSLKWMMDHATKCGLDFEESTRQIYEDLADPLGQIADSRAGLALYYRYKPRAIEKLCAEAGLDSTASDRKPLIHQSVIRRITSGTDQYAPMGLPCPTAYKVIASSPDNDPSSELELATDEADAVTELSKRDSTKDVAGESELVREEAKAVTYGYTRMRRGLYYTFVALTLAFLAVGFFGTHPGKLAWLDGFFYRVINLLTEWSAGLAPPYTQVLPTILIVLTPPVIALITLCSRSLNRIPDNVSENVSESHQQLSERRVSKESATLEQKAGHASVTPAELSDPHPFWTIAFQSFGLILLAMILRPLAHWIVTALMPSAAESLVGVLGSPSWFALFGGAFYFVLRLNSFFHSRMREWAVHAWQVSLGESKPGAVQKGWWDTQACRFTDRSKWIGIFDDWVVPSVAFLLLGIFLAFPIWITVRDVLIRMRLSPVTTVEQQDSKTSDKQSEMDPEGLVPESIDPDATVLHFDTSRIVDTAYSVNENAMYVIAIERRQGGMATNPEFVWQDGTINASSGIVTSSDEILPQTALSGLKRLPDEPYFRLVGSIDDPTAASIAITPGIPFTVPRSGRLYLAVNDVPGFYSNNHGVGTVWIWKLRHR